MDKTTDSPPNGLLLYSHYVLEPRLEDRANGQSAEAPGTRKTSTFYPCIVYNTTSEPGSNSKKYTVRRLGQKRKERIVEGLLVDVQKVFSGAKRIIANFLPHDEQYQYNRARTIPAEDIFHILTFDGDVSYGLFYLVNYFS
jgi:hypothetical protein